MQEEKRGLTARYAAIQALYWANYALLSAFASIYLLDQGFSNTQIGLLLAAAGGLAAIVQPVLAARIDRAGGNALQRAVYALLLLFLAAAALVAVLHHGSLLPIALCYGVCLIVLYVLTPLIYALGMRAGGEEGLNFSFARGMGSLAYALLSQTLGWVIPHTGTRLLPLLMVGMYALLLLAVRGLPAGAESVTRAPQNALRPLAFLRKYRRFACLLAGMVGVYIGHTLLNNYLFQIVVSKGGSERELGTVVMLACFCEMPAVFGGAWLRRRFKTRGMLAVSLVFFTVKLLLSLLAANMTVYYLVQITQLLAYGLVAVNSVYYVEETIDPADAVKGQAYFTTAQTLASLAGVLLGGWLLDAAGVQTMLLCGLAISAVGTAVGLLALLKK